jgi:hypothetical protein
MTTTSDALDALRLAMTTDSRDWGLNHGDAWIYGIAVGWHCEEDHDHELEYCEGGAFDVVADRHGWTAVQRSQLRSLRRAVAEHQLAKVAE